MILEFRVKNYRSIKDEQVLSFISQSKESKSKGNYTSSAFGDVLKSIAIYGANASGKSNVLRALYNFWEIVAKSAEIDSNLPSIPFRFSKQVEPTEYEIYLCLEDKLYRYGFSFDRQKILEEWLFCKDKDTKRESEIFYRCLNGENYDYKYGRSFQGEKKAFEERTRANSLFLSKCAFENHPLMREIFLFIKSKIVFLGDRDQYYPKDPSDSKLLRQQEELLKSAGIEFDSLQLGLQEGTINLTSDKKELIIQPIYSFIKGGIEFQLSDESEGTRRLLGISIPIIKTIEEGGMLVVDELEKSLHPFLVEQIIKAFHDAKNTKAQLLFSTHNTSILKGSLFSKDQIYFTEKKDYATELYSLLEFKNVRSEDNYEKKYLLGTYGALPILQNFDLSKEDL